MASFRNPVLDGGPGVDHGDPFVLREPGRYLLYHTGGRAIPVLESADLVEWSPRGEALHGAGPAHWAQVDLWAPEVMRDGDELFMYAAATRAGGDREASRRLGVARARDPLGPFAWDDRPLVADAWSIDGHPQRDDDGGLWLFYNTRTGETRGPRGRPGSGNVVDRMPAPDRVEGAPSPVVLPDARWEANPARTAWWNEGAWVLRRRGTWYQQYSGSLFSAPTYAVGGAFAPGPRGPWVKDGANPTFRGSASIQGPGHNCVTLAPDGVTPYAVYHGRVGVQRGRKVHLDRLWWVGERPLIAALGGGPPTRPTSRSQPRPPGPAVDPDVAHWRATAWAHGDLRVAGTPVALPDGAMRRVELAARGGGEIAVRIDGAVRPTLPYAAPELAGDLDAQVVTSCLEDEALVTLAPGERLAWPWGGRRPVEVSLAVRGRAEVRVGEARRDVRSRRDAFRLALLVSHSGADEIEVLAGEGGATVGDLLVVTRTADDAAEIAALAERQADGSPLRRLVARLRGA